MLELEMSFKIASFTEIPFQGEAPREVLNAAFCVCASFTEMEIEKPQDNSLGAKCRSLSCFTSI